MNKLVIGISGFKGHGKDTLAKLISKHKYYAQNCSPKDNFHITAFAAPVKEMLKDIFNVTHDQLSIQALKEKPFENPIVMDDYLSQMSERTKLSLNPLNKIALSIRDLMQMFGTDYVRSVQDNYWIKKWLKEVKNHKYVIVSDIRFLNEAEAVKSLNGIIVRIFKDDFISHDNHQSESEQEKIKIDYAVRNIQGKPYLLNKFAKFLADY
jgi:hypothetical protein